MGERLRKKVKLELNCNPLHDFLYNLSETIKYTIEFNDRESLNRTIIEMYDAVTNRTYQYTNGYRKLVINEEYYHFIPDNYTNIITKTDFICILYFLLNEYVNLDKRNDEIEFSIFIKMYNEIRTNDCVKNLRDKVILSDLFYINNVLKNYIQ